MKRWFGFGVGVLWVALLLVGPVPRASAQDLAPGVWCDGLYCANDTDQVYFIWGAAGCLDPVYPVITFSEMFPPHTARILPDVVCPNGFRTGDLVVQGAALRPPTLSG